MQEDEECIGKTELDPKPISGRSWKRY